ncbi:HAD-IB family hydrolase [Actinocrinis puniceicyclus]|uniref:HAD-IB family hydrolase n=1 Tax=Actinocrinis puniceicyclus TaxID=977794 RepID=A0A8J7WQV9_9ACTN|nr:HAD-IB family hydrolase [Actinocrinis puniceicyclus]MBS2965060.1 HAD-IB family hydrolase [Actinocrinis puniceicyclus]
MAPGLDAPSLVDLELLRSAARPRASDPRRHGPRTAAFFDLDNTLVQGASLFHLARGLAAHRMLTGRDIARFGLSQLTFRIRGERAGQVESTRRRALSFAAGHAVTEMTEICRSVFEDYLERKIWPGTRALAQAHLNRGEPVWLLTAAPNELADIVAQRLGLTGALGTVAEAVDGVYSGRVCGDILHGPAKGVAMRALAEREGYTLTSCHAYSDSANDLPMLTAVGHPHAVNPDHKLRHHAQRQGWPVIEYRTGVRLMRIGLPSSAAVGATASAVAAGAALRRAGRRREATDSVAG